VKVKVGDKVFEAPSWRGALGDALASKGRTSTTVNQRLRAVADLMAGREVQIASIVIKPVKEGR
jgi:hypothetical protein